jgi:hypothetical protein
VSSLHAGALQRGVTAAAEGFLEARGQLGRRDFASGDEAAFDNAPGAT